MKLTEIIKEREEDFDKISLSRCPECYFPLYNSERNIKSFNHQTAIKIIEGVIENLQRKSDVYSQIIGLGHRDTILYASYKREELEDQITLLKKVLEEIK